MSYHYLYKFLKSVETKNCEKSLNPKNQINNYDLFAAKNKKYLVIFYKIYLQMN